MASQDEVGVLFYRKKRNGGCRKEGKEKKRRKGFLRKGKRGDKRGMRRKIRGRDWAVKRKVDDEQRKKEKKEREKKKMVQ